MTGLIFLALTGCDMETLLTLPPKEGEAMPVGPGKGKVRERRLILPGSISGPPPPEPGVYASQCSEITDGGPVNGPDCITDTIQCGEQVVGHTIGGVKRFNGRFYEKNFCTPNLDNREGGDERVYRLDMPDGDWTAHVTMHSPCADLDLAAFKWQDPDTCPPPNTERMHRCDMWPKDGTSKERVILVSQKETHWYLVVEGKDAEEGAFSITVQCREGLW